MRILFVTDHIHYPQGGGGAERNTHELCLALQDQGHEPAVLSNLSPNPSLLSWSVRLRRKLPPQPAFPADKVCGYPVFRGWDFDRAAETVASFGPDAVIVQSTDPAPLLRVLAAAGSQMAAYIHEVEQPEPLAALADWPIPVLANSDFTASRLNRLFGLHCRVVLPLVDRSHYVLPETQPERLLFVNTVPRKGVEVALRLAERRPDIPCDFVTSWILKDGELKRLQDRAATAGNIVLHAPTNDMRPLYTTAKLLLAPSQWEETWGRVATEAHINAIPVLGSDRGGLPQAIGPGGLVVPAEAPIENWADALSQLWDDPETYSTFSRAARSYADRDEIRPASVVATLVDAVSVR